MGSVVIVMASPQRHSRSSCRGGRLPGGIAQRQFDHHSILVCLRHRNELCRISNPCMTPRLCLLQTADSGRNPCIQYMGGSCIPQREGSENPQYIQTHTSPQPPPGPECPAKTTTVSSSNSESSRGDVCGAWGTDLSVRSLLGLACAQAA